MAKSIKCKYCGKKYEVQNSHDCCPSCGAFNEFDIKENNIPQNQGNIVYIEKKQNPFAKILKTGLCFMGGFFILGLVLSATDGDDDDYGYVSPSKTSVSYSSTYKPNKDSYVGESSKKEINYDDYVKEVGTWDEMLAKYEIIEMDRHKTITTTISIDEKIDINGITLYLDKLKYEFTGSTYSKYAYIDINMEVSNPASEMNSDIDVYLVYGDSKDRLSESDYFAREGLGMKYFKDMEELLTHEFQGKTDWEISVNGFHVYDSLRIVIDGVETDIPLVYNDTETLLSYYNYK